MNKKAAVVLNPVDVVAGILIILAGIVTITGQVNLGVVLGGIGFLIEAIRMLLQSGP